MKFPQTCLVNLLQVEYMEVVKQNKETAKFLMEEVRFLIYILYIYIYIYMYKYVLPIYI